MFRAILQCDKKSAKKQNSYNLQQYKPKSKTDEKIEYRETHPKWINTVEEKKTN